MDRLRGKIFILFFSFWILYADAIPGPPSVPEIQAVNSSEKITLIWNNVAENSIDSLTGYSDFEGYRIYRSTDGGVTWGESVNYLGNHIGWRPYTQFDLISNVDSLHCTYTNAYYDGQSEFCGSPVPECGDYCRGKNIYGYDPMASWINIGDNDSLKRTFVDTDVYDGVEYTYAVTAYDMGMKSHTEDFHILYEYNDTLRNTYTYDPTEEEDPLWNIEDCDALCDLDNDEIFESICWNEAVCRTMHHCNWDITACEYSKDDYCDGDDSYCDTIYAYCDEDDSYCDGMECSGGGCNLSGYIFPSPSEEDCYLYFTDAATWVAYSDPETCEDAGNPSGSFDYNWISVEEIYLDEETCDGAEHTWIIIEYLDEESCEDAGDPPGSGSFGHEWIEVIYTDETTCETEGHDWVLVEYLDKTTCEEAGDPPGSGSFDYKWEIVYFTSDTTWSANNPDHFLGIDYSTEYNKLWGYPSFESPKLMESFTDYNINNKCDFDENSGDFEPFIDEDGSDQNQNGKCDEVGDWTSRCQDDANDCINAIVVQAGYKASNITFPADNPEIEFIIPDSGNVGNGLRLYNIVNEYDLKDEVLRFEINASLDPSNFGDLSGSFATQDPGLYIYEIKSLNNFAPDSTWDKYVTNLSQDSLEYYLDLPGVEYNSSDNNFISIPKYKVANFLLTNVDDPQYTTNYTDWFDGIQFRFDNGPNSFNGNPLQFVELREIIFSPTSILLDGQVVSEEDMFTINNVPLAGIKMKYKFQTDLAKRPSYTYKIEFSDSTLDTAVYGVGRKCEATLTSKYEWTNYPENSHTLLPFKVTNLSTGKKVNLEHKDRGVNYSHIEFGENSAGDCLESECLDGYACFEGNCAYESGYKNCNWEHNEFVTLVDLVYTTDFLTDEIDNNEDGFVDEEHEGSYEKLFNLKIDFDGFDYVSKHIPNFMDYFNSSSSANFYWSPDVSYVSDSIVEYEDMLYKATEPVSVTNPPDEWYDDDEDGNSDNPWQILYPWNDGDSIILEPYVWYKDGDAWVADISIIGEIDENSADDLQNISVVPNPYIVNSTYFNASADHKLIRFTRLPNKCDISIYTVSGEFITTISHDDPFDGNEWWDLKNGRGQEVAPGLYIYTIVTPSGNKKIDKFAIVR